MTHAIGSVGVSTKNCSLGKRCKEDPDLVRVHIHPCLNCHKLFCVTHRLPETHGCMGSREVTSLLTKTQTTEKTAAVHGNHRGKHRRKK